MHCQCGTNNRAPRWTFTDPCKPEVIPGAREVSVSPSWLAAPAMIARDTTKVYIWRLDTGCWPTLFRKCHSHNAPGKVIITLESNPSRGTVLPAQHCKGNKYDKNLNYKRLGSNMLKRDNCYNNIASYPLVLSRLCFLPKTVIWTLVLRALLSIKPWQNTASLFKDSWTFFTVRV